MKCVSSPEALARLLLSRRAHAPSLCGVSSPWGVKSTACAPRGFFITGTDTGVGKTFVACALLRAFAARGIVAAGLKPLSCGGRADVRALRRLSAGRPPLEVVNPVALARPLAPAAQPHPAWREIVAKMRTSLRHPAFAGAEVVLVEGAGGLLCPVDGSRTMRDLAVALRWPIVLVAADQLGALNHILLTIEAAERSGLEVAAVYLNRLPGPHDRACASNRHLLRRMFRTTEKCSRRL